METESKIQAKVEDLLQRIELGDESAKDDLKKLTLTLDIQRQKNSEKAARLEAEREANGVSSNQPVKVEPQAQTDDFWKTSIEFKTGAGRELPVDLAEEILTIAKAKGKAPSEVMNDPFVKNGIEATLSQRKAEMAAQVDASSTSDIERKYTPDMLKNMSQADLEKIIPQG